MPTLSLKAKATTLIASTILLTIVGVSIATVLLRRESLSPDPNRFYGIPVGAFTLLITLSSALAVTVVTLIWLDYGAHKQDERAQRNLEEQVARRTEQLQHANERLQEMDRIKTELIHRVSHELRTPLTSIVGYSELLLDARAGPLNALQSDFLRTLAGNATRLHALVDGILEISRWESGTQRMDWGVVSLAELTRAALESLRPVAEAQGKRFCYTPPEIPPLVRGDDAKLVQLITNLLDNAMKYTPGPGAIEVSVARLGEEAAFTVHDHGIGIPKAFMPHLFGKFERAPNADNPAFPGTGLGLYLVRQIVDAHGGSIDLESEPGQGTTVTARFPLAPPDVETEAAEPPFPAPAPLEEARR